MKGIKIKRCSFEGWLWKYTLMYLLLAIPMAACLVLSGKTFIWGTDSYYQQYTTLSYTGSMLRNLLSGNYAAFEFSLGPGLDALATLGYYGLTDPLQWLGLFFKGEGVNLYYHLLTFFYIYFSGLIFCYFVRKYVVGKGNAWLIALSGFIYATSGYQTIGIIKNPYYAAGGIYLVLMLIAVERVLRERKWAMMSLITMLMLMANFYLAYQTTLMVVLYILIRLAFRLRKRGVKESAKDGFTLLGSYLLGLGLSMVFLLPSAINFLASGRVEVSSGYTDSLLHYPWAYYLKLAALFCAPYDYAGYWALQSFCPLALFAAVLLFVRDKRPDMVKQQLRACFLVMVVCLCLPLAGKVFNGFGYVTNRWSYGFAVMVSAVAAWGMPRMFAAEYEGRKKLAVFGLVWAAAMLVYGVFAHKIPAFEGGSNVTAVSDYGIGTKNVAPIAGALALGVSSLCLLALDKRFKLQPEKMIRVVALLGAVCCFAYSFGYAVVAATSVEFKKNNINFQIENQTAAVAGQIADDSFYRVDTGSGTDNHAVLLDYNGTSYYWSMVPEWVTSHYTDLQLSTQQWTFRLDALGSDTYLNELASAKYAVRKFNEHPVSLPYGYRYIDEVHQQDGETIKIYENDYALPLGYVFNRVLTREEYESMPPLEKRRALVSCALLEENETGLAPYVHADAVRELEWEVLSSDGVEIVGNELRGKQGGTITLGFDGGADCEVYLQLNGTQLLSVNNDTDIRIDSLTEDGTNRMYIILPGGNFNYNQQGACMRLGYSEEGLKECMLKFTMDGVLHFDEMKLMSVPMEGYRNAVAEIRENGLWDVQPENDCIRGPVSVKEAGILQISLPYSSGWTATVDGRAQELMHCGGMYMGLLLEEGEHQVELRYETPGLRAGAWISLGSALVLALAWMLGRRRASRR